MKKLKELVILYPSFERGGATNNLINFMEYCLKQNLKLTLVSNIKKNDLFFKNKKKNIKLVNLENHYFINNSSRFITSLNSIFKLIPLLKTCKKDSSIFLSFQSHILPIIICKIFSQKIIIRNSEDPHDATKYADNKLSAVITLLFKFIFYRFADGIITNSRKSKQSLQKIVKNEIQLIFNPYLKKLNNYNQQKRKNVILSVGRLCKQKNQITIIKAFKIFLQKFPNYKLVLIGHGNYLKKLKNLVMDLNIKNDVKFLGWIKNTKKHYLSSKMFVFPSLYEGLPNALIDSINYNLPPISSKCSGAEDILGISYNNFVSRYNYKQLSNKMVNVINNYSKSLLKLKKIKKNLDRFLIKEQSSRYLIYCKKILNKD